jgi:hypothetical protein
MALACTCKSQLLIIDLRCEDVHCKLAGPIQEGS